MIRFVFKPKRRVKGKVVTSRLYSGRYQLPDGRVKTVPLKVTDKQVAEKKLEQIVKEQEWEMAGIIAPKAIRESAKKTTEVHLGDFLTRLATLGRDQKYCQNLRARLARLIKECGWYHISEINAEAFEVWRTKQKQKAPKTLNEYLDAANALLNWLVKTERSLTNPLKCVEKVDTRGREVRLRRALPTNEVTRLVSASGVSRVGILLAVHTGLRRKELDALVWGDINLDSERPSISVVAGTAKNRKAAVLRLHPELSTELRAVRPEDAHPNDKVLIGKMLPGMWKFKSDLKRAGIEFNENGRRVDFHALRHTFNTNVVKTDIPPRVAMEMMRHSDLNLTMKVYTDAKQLPVDEGFRSLPAFVAHDSNTQIRTQIPDPNRLEPSQIVAPFDNQSSPQIVGPETHSDTQRRKSTQMDRVRDLAPEVGFEPTTNRLTADRSTTELLWIVSARRFDGAYILPVMPDAASVFPGSGRSQSPHCRCRLGRINLMQQVCGRPGAELESPWAGRSSAKHIRLCPVKTNRRDKRPAFRGEFGCGGGI
jgi:integrase